jgi:hypothetical protein
MGDSYGTMILSNQSKADTGVLLTKLNRYLWNSEFIPIEYSDGRFFVPGMVQYPSIFVRKKVILDDEGEPIDQSDPRYDEPLNLDWDLDLGDDVDLTDLIKDIGSILQDGELHIVTSCSYRDFSIRTYHLVIRSDQTGTLAAIEGSDEPGSCAFKIDQYN